MDYCSLSLSLSHTHTHTHTHRHTHTHTQKIIWSRGGNGWAGGHAARIYSSVPKGEGNIDDYLPRTRLEKWQGGPSDLEWLSPPTNMSLSQRTGLGCEFNYIPYSTSRESAELQCVTAKSKQQLNPVLTNIQHHNRVVTTAQSNKP